MKGQFIDNAKLKGFGEYTLQKIWTDWEAFAQYAFNKSHSTCYAYVAYQTAYLKSHYPGEYMSAVLNHAGSIEKITFFMEECKRMGIKVLGPDINESKKGFAVNQKGEIRFGLGGLKGCGEAAVENIIEEREKNGWFKNIFDFIKRINQRAVNKKTLESLVYAGGFDCFPEHHRAQFFHTVPEDPAPGLEKIIRFGQVYQQNTLSSSNTLFGDLPMAIEIRTPTLPPCDPWPLIVQLDFEKEVTGMFLSGHPLDHYKFELKHYGITPSSEFNEFRDSVALQPSPGRNFRLAGLVTVADHKISRKGNKYGSFTIEDYSGKTDLVLWGDDYVKFTPFLQTGGSLFITGFFKQRFNTAEYEFKITGITMVETIKRSLTKQLIIDVHPKNISRDMVNFIEENVKKFPGRSLLRVNLTEPRENLKISLVTMDNGFEMNDELIDFLETNPELEVQVTSN